MFINRLNIISMSSYISSITVVLTPKDFVLGESLVTQTLYFSPGEAISTFCAIQRLYESPLVKPYFSKHHISNLFFQYTLL